MVCINLKGEDIMIFGLIKLVIVLCFFYCLLRYLKRKHPDSEFIEFFEFVVGLLEGLVAVGSIALMILLVLGLLFLL